MKKVLFIDRDGTIIKETADEQIDAFEKMIFYPKVFTYLGKIAKAIASADPKRFKPDKNMYRHFLNTLLREEPRKIYTK